MTLNTTGTNAAVGPPICTREPPSSEIRKPATIAVCRPLSGVVPEAIASAIESGSATIDDRKSGDEIAAQVRGA